MVPGLKSEVFLPGMGADVITTYDYRPTEDDKRRMSKVIGHAQLAHERGDNPIAAMLVDLQSGQEWVAETTEMRRGYSEAHAEKRAQAKAMVDVPKLGHDLSGCAMLSDAEPCVGCAHMMDQTNLGMLIIAATREDAPEFFRQKTLRMHDVFRQSEHGIIVISGLMVVDALALLTKENKRHMWTGEDPEAVQEPEPEEVPTQP